MKLDPSPSDYFAEALEGWPFTWKRNQKKGKEGCIPKKASKKWTKFTMYEIPLGVRWWISNL
jgi:hypothetical protein